MVTSAKLKNVNAPSPQSSVMWRSEWNAKLWYCMPTTHNSFIEVREAAKTTLYCSISILHDSHLSLSYHLTLAWLHSQIKCTRVLLRQSFLWKESSKMNRSHGTSCAKLMTSHIKRSSYSQSRVVCARLILHRKIRKRETWRVRRGGVPQTTVFTRQGRRETQGAACVYVLHVWSHIWVPLPGGCTLSASVPRISANVFVRLWDVARSVLMAIASCCSGPWKGSVDRLREWHWGSWNHSWWGGWVCPGAGACWKGRVALFLPGRREREGQASCPARASW